MIELHAQFNSFPIYKIHVNYQSSWTFYLTRTPVSILTSQGPGITVSQDALFHLSLKLPAASAYFTSVTDDDIEEDGYRNC